MRRDGVLRFVAPIEIDAVMSQANSKLIFSANGVRVSQARAIFVLVLCSSRLWHVNTVRVRPSATMQRGSEFFENFVAALHRRAGTWSMRKAPVRVDERSHRACNVICIQHA